MSKITEIKAALKFYDAPGRRQYLNPKERIALRGLCVEARLPVPMWLRNAKPEHEIENTVDAILKGEYRFDIGGKSISDRVASILKALPRKLTPDIGEDRKPVARPGSRGGKGYYDDKGKWQYGIKPMPRVKKQEKAAGTAKGQAPFNDEKADEIINLLRQNKAKLYGKIGDLFLDPKLRALYKDVLDVKVWGYDGETWARQKGQHALGGYVLQSTKHPLAGAILLPTNNKKTQERIVGILLEEAAHAMRDRKGRAEYHPHGRAEQGELDVTGYENDPSEMSADKMVEHAKQIITAALLNRNASKGKGKVKQPKELPATISINGVQRSTQNSNGQPIHPTIEGIKKFWEWFGDSKVVDKGGEPKVVYHGTPNAGFKEFHPETHFTTNPEYASHYTERSASSIQYKQAANAKGVYPTYLKITKPFDTRNANSRNIFQNEYEAYYSPNLTERNMVDWMEVGDLSEWLKENHPEYDGIYADEGGIGGYGGKVVSRGVSIVPFSPTQIKSATGNAGTFDANDPDITKSLSDRVLEILKAGPTGYKLHGRRKWHGLDVSIENRKGSVRTGTDDDGHEWRTKLDFPYGYIRMTDAVDGDHLDCFIGPESEAKKVYVVHQKDPETGEFDEDKCMLDFASRKAAIKAYKSQYNRPGYLQSVTTFTVDKFIEKITNARGGIKKIGEKTLQKSITERIMSIIKGRKYPIGHVSTHKDGTRWRKVGEPSKWEPIEGGAKATTVPAIPRNISNSEIKKRRKYGIPLDATGVEYLIGDRNRKASYIDSKGRKQTKYSKRHVDAAKKRKFRRMRRFSKVLPTVRRRISKDMISSEMTEVKAAATVVAIIDTTHIRRGTEKYAERNQTYGASTLLKKHVKINGSKVTFDFAGKKGVRFVKTFDNPALASVLSEYMKLPGDQLIQYNKNGEISPLPSYKVNAYLKPYKITPKDFRTFAATRIFIEEASVLDGPNTTVRKKSLALAIERTASALNNTPGVCKNSYVDPLVMQAFMEGEDMGKAYIAKAIEGGYWRALSGKEDKFRAFLNEIAQKYGIEE